MCGHWLDEAKGQCNKGRKVRNSIGMWELCALRCCSTAVNRCDQFVEVFVSFWISRGFPALERPEENRMEEKGSLLLYTWLQRTKCFWACEPVNYDLTISLLIIPLVVNVWKWCWQILAVLANASILCVASFWGKNLGQVHEDPMSWEKMSGYKLNL